MSSTSAERKVLEARPPFELSEHERRICNLLLDTTSYLKSTRPDLPSVTCRVAGGWVRDKFMGRESKDMDITVDSMTGYEFADHLHNYVHDHLKSPQILGHHGSIVKIKANPEKSKHLETATARILGFEVDFCNLRLEVYQEGSRIPSMEFGTPYDDASRRDLTINSLFYNLHTSLIEDHLGLGISDIRDGIIRTPLRAYETFRDDPLRVLRAIRFASRFNYSIEQDIPKAVRNPDILEVLGRMVSKERVGVEVVKMMADDNYVVAAQHIVDFDIYRCIFSMPPGVSYGNLKLDSAVQALQLLKKHSKASSMPLRLACLLFPLNERVFEYGKRRIKKPVSLFVSRDSLKLSSRESESVAAIHEHSRRLPILVERFKQLDSTQVNNDLKDFRQEFATFLRGCRHSALGLDLNAFFDFSLVAELIRGDMDEKLIQKNRAVYIPAAIERLGLEDIHNLQPILNGNEIIQIVTEALDGKKCATGRWLGDLNNSILNMQLREDKWKSPTQVREMAESMVRQYALTNKILSI